MARQEGMGKQQTKHFTRLLYKGGNT